jgi:hypothetical protein
MASMAGLRYSDMLRLIIEAAQERIAAQRQNLLEAAEASAVMPAERLVAGRR